MKLLALGATGAIGVHLIGGLAPEGHEIHVTSRRALAPSGDIHYIQGDAKDEAFLRHLLRQRWDVIVDFMVYDTAGFGKRMEALLDATDQYIFTSSARVFANSAQPLVESSPRLLDVSKDQTFLATDEYALSKARQEDMLRASGQTNWTIIRPYITFGKGRLQLGTLEKEAWLPRALQGRSIVFCDALMDKWTTMTDGADVAAMIGSLVGRPEALGEDFNLSGGQAETWGEILTLYLDRLEAHLGKRPTVVLQDLEQFCEAAPSVPQVVYDRMYDRRFDLGKIGSFHDLRSLPDCRTRLAARLDEQLSEGGFLPLDARAEALRDKALGQQSHMKYFAGARQKARYLLYRHVPQEFIRRMKGS